MKALEKAYREYVKTRDDYLGARNRLSKPLKAILFRAYMNSQDRLINELGRVFEGR